MKSLITKRTEEVLREQKSRKRYFVVFLCLAAAVSLGTILALRYSGIAMTHKETILNCQYEVHEHGEDCYAEGEKDPVCGYADYAVHVHNDDCFDSDGKLVCRLQEREKHEHEDACYAEEQVLICTQEESAGHQHQEACYQTEKGGLACTKPEHTHTDACYSESAACTKPEHTHTDACYGEDGSLICTQEEHTHDDTCSAQTSELVCTQEEHVHDDTCYEQQQTLVCGMEEGEGSHIHGDSCYEVEEKLVCGELELHTHEAECYDKDNNLICGLLQLEEHVHTKECLETVELTGDEIEESIKNAAQAGEDESESGEETEENSEGEDESESGDESESEDESESGEAAEGSGEAEESSEEGEESESGEETEDEETEDEEDFSVMIKTVETEKYIVTVTYTKEANLPKEAKLQVIEYSKDSERYKERSEALGYEPEWLLNIGFFVDGVEVEPETEVSVRVSVKDCQESSGYDIVHFTDDGMEPVEATEVTDEEGNAAVEFVTGSFSDYSGKVQRDGNSDPRGVDLSSSLTGLKIKVDGKEYTKDDKIPIRATQSFFINLQFATEDLKDGKYYYELPEVDALQMFDVSDGKIYDPEYSETTPSGTYVVKNGVIEITMDPDYIKNRTNCSMEVEMEAQWEKGTQGDHTIIFGGDQEITFGVDSANNLKIEKDHWYERKVDTDPASVVYRVKVEALSDQTGVQLYDTMTEASLHRYTEGEGENKKEKEDPVKVGLPDLTVGGEMSITVVLGQDREDLGKKAGESITVTRKVEDKTSSLEQFLNDFNANGIVKGADGQFEIGSSGTPFNLKKGDVLTLQYPMNYSEELRWKADANEYDLIVNNEAKVVSDQTKANENEEIIARDSWGYSGGKKNVIDKSSQISEEDPYSIRWTVKFNEGLESKVKYQVAGVTIQDSLINAPALEYDTKKDFTVTIYNQDGAYVGKYTLDWEKILQENNRSFQYKIPDSVVVEKADGSKESITLKDQYYYMVFDYYTHTNSEKEVITHYNSANATIHQWPPIGVVGEARNLDLGVVKQGEVVDSEKKIIEWTVEYKVYPDSGSIREFYMADSLPTYMVDEEIRQAQLVIEDGAGNYRTYSDYCADKGGVEKDRVPVDFMGVWYSSPNYLNFFKEAVQMEITPFFGGSTEDISDWAVFASLKPENWASMYADKIAAYDNVFIIRYWDPTTNNFYGQSNYELPAAKGDLKDGYIIKLTYKTQCEDCPPLTDLINEAICGYQGIDGKGGILNVPAVVMFDAEEAKDSVKIEKSAAADPNNTRKVNYTVEIDRERKGFAGSSDLIWTDEFDSRMVMKEKGIILNIDSLEAGRAGVDLVIFNPELNASNNQKDEAGVLYQYDEDTEAQIYTQTNIYYGYSVLTTEGKTVTDFTIKTEVDNKNHTLTITMNHVPMTSNATGSDPRYPRYTLKYSLELDPEYPDYNGGYGIWSDLKNVFTASSSFGKAHDFVYGQDDASLSLTNKITSKKLIDANGNELTGNRIEGNTARFRVDFTVDSKLRSGTVFTLNDSMSSNLTLNKSSIEVSLVACQAGTNNVLSVPIELLDGTGDSGLQYYVKVAKAVWNSPGPHTYQRDQTTGIGTHTGYALENFKLQMDEDGKELPVFKVDRDLGTHDFSVKVILNDAYKKDKAGNNVDLGYILDAMLANNNEILQGFEAGQWYFLLRFEYTASVKKDLGTDTANIQNTAKLEEYSDSEEVFEEDITVYSYSGSSGGNLKTIDIEKLDAANNVMLSGAEFKLYGPDSADSNEYVEIDSLVTGADGKVSLDYTKVKPFVAYYLKEYKAPGGYVLDSDTEHWFYIAVDTKMNVPAEQGDASAGEPEALTEEPDALPAELEPLTEISRMTDSGGNVVVTYKYSWQGTDYQITSAEVDKLDELVITSKNGSAISLGDTISVENRKPELTITKVSADKNVEDPLTGAKFALYRDEDCTELYKELAEEGTKGIYYYKGLEFDAQNGTKYYLKEVTAPEGYELDERVYTVEISSAGKVAIKDLEPADDGTYHIENKKAGYILPETGGSGMIPYTVSGFAVLGAGLMYGFSRKRRRENSDTEVAHG